MAGPFGCRCPSSIPCSVSTPRSSNRTCAFNASGSRTRTQAFAHEGLWPATPPAASQPSPEVLGSSPISGCRCCGRRPGTEVPSLRRHYSVSPVLWTSPTPHAARPVPRGRPVGSRTHRLGSPVLRALSWCRHAVAITPVGPRGACSLALPPTSAFPIPLPGRLPHYDFRGLLGVHSRYGLPARGAA